MSRIRTILAVMRRQFTIMVRYPTWVIQLIIWPLIFPLIYIMSAVGFAGPDGAGLATFNAAAGTNNFVAYIVVGTMAWQWVNITMWNFGTYLRDEQMLGTLESNWLCPINKFDFLIGAGLVDILKSILIIIISMLEYRFIYGINFTGNVLYWGLIFIVMFPGVYGLGSIFASLVLWAKETGAAVQLVRGIMMMLCGITFPIAIMPIWMQNLAKTLPFTYGISAARQIMVNGQSVYEASYNILLCLIEGIILLILGRVAFMYTEKRVKNQGALGRY
ncbi:ABC transporter permease [Haloimpatiens sp. FM7330]|uniref:ABC transporter permease n=1 Tax=Haloimpatiens sp. FM7330 TaxID=3298610 RepID=UPI00364275E5